MTDDTAWTPVMGADGQPRQPLSDRIVRGVLTAEGVDKQGDVVHQKALMHNMDNIAKYAVMSFNHGMDELGNADFIPMGRMHKWRVVGDTIEHESSVYPTEFSPLINKCWGTMQEWGFDNLGWSIGGRSLEKDCKDGVCDITKADVVEYAATRSPAMPRANTSHLALVKQGEDYLVSIGDNQFILNKTMEMRKMEEEDEEEKESKRCKERYKKTVENIKKGGWKTALEAVNACETCDEYVQSEITIMGKSTSQAMLALQNLIDNQGGETLTKEKDKDKVKKEEEKEKAELPPEKDEEKEKKQETTPKSEDPGEEDLMPEKKSLERIEALEKMLTGLTEKVVAVQDSLSKMEKAAGQVEKQPPKPAEPTLKEAITMVVKAGYPIGQARDVSGGIGSEQIDRTVETIMKKKEDENDRLKKGDKTVMIFFGQETKED